MATLQHNDPVAGALMTAIRTGDLEALEGLLGGHPGLATARIQGHDGGSRTPLHVATDWPGFFPNGARVVATLIRAGADPDARLEGTGQETPLHWAASSDDADVAAALIDGGADLEAPGASIAGGTALDNAVAYGCWQVARLLVDRGARVGKLWHAAALGLMSVVEARCAASPAPTPAEINDAFWQACHGGQPRAAAYLLARGADVEWVPDYSRKRPAEIAAVPATRRDTLLSWLQQQGAGGAG